MNIKDFDIESGYTSGIKWCMIRIPKEGEDHCGDLHVIEKYRDKALVAVIDGLGHGQSAADASRRVKYLIKESSYESIINIIDYCHQKSKDTRGAVVSLAIIDSWERTLTWLGVGNVQGILVPGGNSNGKDYQSLVSRKGIVGYKLPSLQASVLPISVGDMLIFTTDGVQNSYIDNVDANNEPQEVVEFIASNYFKKSDDALILAARFLGEETHEETR